MIAEWSMFAFFRFLLLLFCLLVKIMIILIEYLGFSETRFSTYYHKSIDRLLLNFKASMRMIDVIPKFATNKIINATKDWRQFWQSVECLTYLVLISDYANSISNIVSNINQRIVHRFNGQYSFYYLTESTKLI